MSNNITTLGEEIRILRLTQKLKQKELAQKTGLSTATIGQIERGKANVSINNLEAIAKALNCELEILMNPKTKLLENKKSNKIKEKL